MLKKQAIDDEEYNDFDDNGQKEQVLTYYLGDREIPFASKAELEKRMPFLRKQFLYAEDLAKASLTDIFGDDKLGKATMHTADYFMNTVFLNNGNMEFASMPLPWEAQLTTYKDAVVVNANGDKLPDILLGGNYYDNNTEMGRYDADFGTLLLNKGGGAFSTSSLGTVAVKGQIRTIKSITISGQAAYLLARNNDSLKVIMWKPLLASRRVPQ